MDIKSMQDPISMNIFPWFLKIVAAIIGALFSLVLSGDIDSEGRIKITTGVIMKFSFSIAVSLYGGNAFIEYYNLSSYAAMSQGFVMLLFAVFGMLIIGVFYQSIQLLKGKPLSEVTSEISKACKSIIINSKGRNQ